MAKEMEKEKNIMIMTNYNLKENILLETEQEEVKIIMMIVNLKENI